MADPRTFTVAPCEPAYSDKSIAAITNSTSAQKAFFDSVGKIGDLSVLNSVGGGSVGRGLRSLAGISSAIRTGTGSLPTSIGSSLDTGASWVLAQTGISQSTVSAVQAFNPGIANQAVAQAKNVFSDVKGGNFTLAKVPNALQDIQNLERLGRNIYTPAQNDISNALGEHCEASPYAMDLIARAPKFKFLFIVQFVTNPGYDGLGSNALNMAFAVKKSSRPNIKFHYDDVNYYNYRTKVITKSEFEEMSMSFHDDTLNYGGMFYYAYMRAMSPITGIPAAGASSDLLEQGGMDFVDNTLSETQLDSTTIASTYAASTGTLYKDNKEIFKEIRLYHLYDNGNEMNVWRFMNPKITALSLDDVDMSVGSEGNELSFQFTYDSVFLDPAVSLAKDKTYNIGQLQRGAIYPLAYNGPAGQGGTLSTNTLTAATASTASLLSPVSNLTSGISSAGKAAVAAVGELGSKFSSALSSLPFGG